MIKCILFDFDGVLTIDKTGSTSITNYISRKTNISLDEKMFNYIKELKNTYYIGLVTDNKEDRIEAILDHKNYKRYFDIVAISAKVHSGKDDCRIFQYVLDDMNGAAEECVFIDNTAKNLIVPAEMGMRTLLFDDENRDFEGFVQRLNAELLEKR